MLTLTILFLGCVPEVQTEAVTRHLSRIVSTGGTGTVFYAAVEDETWTTQMGTDGYVEPIPVYGPYLSAVRSGIIRCEVEKEMVGCQPALSLDQAVSALRGPIMVPLGGGNDMCAKLREIVASIKESGTGTAPPLPDDCK